MKILIVVIVTIYSIGLVYCDYYGAGFPVHRPAFVPGAIRYKKIPFRYLGINYVNRYGFHDGSGGGEEDVSGHDDSDGHDGEDIGGGGGLGLVRRYLGVFAPTNGGYFPSLFSSHHYSQESGNDGRYGDRHESDHGGGHGSGHRDRHGYGGSHGGADSEHGSDRDLSFSHRDEHHSYSDRSPGLLGIRVNGLSWLRRPFGKGLIDKILG